MARFFEYQGKKFLKDAGIGKTVPKREGRINEVASR